MKKFSTKFLFKEISASTLGFLRILYGIFMLKDFMLAYTYFVNSLSKQEFFATYDGFHWVQILPGAWLYLFFGLMFVSCALFVLGIHYRLNALITFVGWTYIFLIDHGHYNNHFYLYCMMHFFFLITDANRWGALDKTEKTTIPYWQLFLFKFEIFVVYFYGAVAKLESDWFQGFPMRYWLHMSSEKFEGTITEFLRTEQAAIFISYTGFIFDLLIGFMLFSPRWRRFAILPIFAFHFSNHFLWDIGTFPFIMFAATFIFYEPDWPERAVAYFKKKKKSIWISFLVGITLIVGGTFFYKITVVLIGMLFFVYFLLHEFKFKYLKWFLPYNPYANKKLEEPTYIFNRRNLVLGFVGTWVFLQLALPFRHWLVKGNPSWTGEGHLFAWRMMLVATTDAVKMKLVVPETGEEYPIAFEKYMNFRQFRKLGRSPRTYHRLAHFIRDKAMEGGMENPIVKMEIWKSVNERAPRLLNDTTLNYAEVPYRQFMSSTWINEWNQNLDPLEFREEKLKHWEFITHEYEKQDAVDHIQGF